MLKDEQVNNPLRKQVGLDELRKEARGSVIVLRRALNEIAHESGTNEVDPGKVKARIKKILAAEGEPA